MRELWEYIEKESFYERGIVEESEELFENHLPVKYMDQ